MLGSYSNNPKMQDFLGISKHTSYSAFCFLKGYSSDLVLHGSAFRPPSAWRLESDLFLLPSYSC